MLWHKPKQDFKLFKSKKKMYRYAKIKSIPYTTQCKKILQNELLTKYTKSLISFVLLCIFFCLTGFRCFFNVESQNVYNTLFLGAK